MVKKKSSKKKKVDLTYLPYFKLKKKKNKKKKENRPTYPVSNFHQIVNTHIFFFGLIGLSFWPVSADLINHFSDAFGPRGEKLNGKQTKFSGKNHQIEPSSDRNP